MAQKLLMPVVYKFFRVSSKFLFVFNFFRKEKKI